MLTPLVTSIRSLRRSRTLRRQIQTRTKNAPSPGAFLLNLGGKRDSNSRPQPGKGCALPTELFPLGRRNSTYSKDGVKRFSRVCEAPCTAYPRMAWIHYSIPANRWIHVLRGCSISVDPRHAWMRIDRLSCPASSAAHARAQRARHRAGSARRRAGTAGPTTGSAPRQWPGSSRRYGTPASPSRCLPPARWGPPNTAGTAARPSARWS